MNKAGRLTQILMAGYKQIDRRRFIRTTLWGGLGITTLGSFSVAELLKRETVKLTILHTNDMHSHIDPFPDNDAKYPGLGGMATRATLIQQIRDEEEQVLLLDAGDVFQGTPYFNIYGGELEFKLMTEMKYDAGTIGNHDFDNGLDGLAEMMPHADFPFLCSNYDFTDTAVDGKTKPYQVFEKGKLKVGVFGLGVELSGLVPTDLFGETKYLDPVEKAAEFSHLLKQDLECDFVVCLSHLGYSYTSDKISDKSLAKQSRNIDLIIGGHTHTFLDEPIPYRNRDGDQVLVAQAGWAGVCLGRIDLYFELGKEEMTLEGGTVSVDKNSIKI